ncbi:MAG: 50S ribosome-binding GTPase [Candidatus Blackburnbacteria bacterium]|nr:50S ribosome-binding GTPase [Candidatus Blackburnbacteria bacterium]
MGDIQNRIVEIEKEIRETPYHKGTEHHIGKLRARLARLQDQIIERQSASRRSGGGGGFAVEKHGDATVVLVGFPSVGKSTLLNSLTNANSRTAPYAFTTVTVIPGMMDYKGAKIQILDVPGLIEGASTGRGRGREVLSVVRSADLLLLLASTGHEEDFNRMNKELHLNGVRINTDRPLVSIKKTLKGGINITPLKKQNFDLTLVSDVAREFGYTNAEISIRDELELNELIDSFARNRVYVPALFVVTKVDELSDVEQGVREIKERGWIPVSAPARVGLEDLKEVIWEKLGLVRVFLRNPETGVDWDHPMIMKSGDKLSDIAEKLGRNLGSSFSGAKIWGSGSKFPGQQMSLRTPVQDGMEVTFV